MALFVSIFQDQLNKDKDYYPETGTAGTKLLNDYHSLCTYGKDGIYETITCDDSWNNTVAQDGANLEKAFHDDKIPNDHTPARWRDV